MSISKRLSFPEATKFQCWNYFTCPNHANQFLISKTISDKVPHPSFTSPSIVGTHSSLTVSTEKSASINFAIGLSLRIWPELVQCLWHFPLTQTKLGRLPSVPEMVSARKTHFWQFADDEKILRRPKRTQTLTHATCVCQTFGHMKCNATYVCVCQYANIRFPLAPTKKKNNWKSWTIALTSTLFVFCFF